MPVPGHGAQVLPQELEPVPGHDAQISARAPTKGFVQTGSSPAGSSSWFGSCRVGVSQSHLFFVRSISLAVIVNV